MVYSLEFIRVYLFLYFKNIFVLYVCRSPKMLGPLRIVELDFFQPSGTNLLKYGLARSTLMLFMI